jgi:2-(1,2-epoxy-1,2-dihydrophenyl)acetyl-CoA isomerase
VAEQSLLTTHQDSVLTLTLNRPEVFNALDAGLLRDLTEALRAAERDDSVRAVVLAAAGRAFCSGQDLKSLDELAPAGQTPHFGPWLRKHYNPLVLRMRRMEKPIVAAVNGVAAGAGMSLALACDLRIASTEASFAEVFSRIGLVPDSGSLYFLPRLLGSGRAMELCLLGDRVDAQQALELGLVNQVVAPEDLHPATHEIAARLATGASKAIALIKRALNRTYEASLEQMLEYEADLQEIAGRSADFREGVLAFSEKRQPRFGVT